MGRGPGFSGITIARLKDSQGNPMNGDIMRGGRDEAVVPGATGSMTGEPHIAGTTSGLMGAGTGTGIAEVSGAVAQWVEQVGRFLGVLQVALEQSRPSE